MSKQCAYCGSEEATTRDHVPPKCLFIDPLPSNLITVPSCQGCQGLSKDDEYFMVGVFIAADGVAHQEGAPSHEVGAVLLEKKREHVMNLLGADLDLGGISSQDCWSDSYDACDYSRKPIAATSHTLDLMLPEKDRIDRVVERIVRGLFYFHRGFRVPGSYAVKTNTSQLDLFPENLSMFAKNSLWNRPTAGHGIIQDGVFIHAFWQAEDDENATVWLLNFYNTLTFAGFTFPRLTS